MPAADQFLAQPALLRLWRKALGISHGFNLLGGSVPLQHSLCPTRGASLRKDGRCRFRHLPDWVCAFAHFVRCAKALIDGFDDAIEPLAVVVADHDAANAKLRPPGVYVGVRCRAAVVAVDVNEVKSAVAELFGGLN